MGRTCSKNGGEEDCVQGFGRKSPRKGTKIRELGIDGRIILKWRNRMGSWNGFILLRI
jgi:hypothetical protein